MSESGYHPFLFLLCYVELFCRNRGCKIIELGENMKWRVSYFFLLIKFLHLSVSSEGIGRYSAILYDAATFSDFIWMVSSRLS